MIHTSIIADGITISGDACNQQYDRYVNGFDCVRTEIDLLISWSVLWFCNLIIGIVILIALEPKLTLIDLTILIALEL